MESYKTIEFEILRLWWMCERYVSIISFETESFCQQGKKAEYGRRKLKSCNNKIAAVFPDGLIVIYSLRWFSRP